MKTQDFLEEITSFNRFPRYAIVVYYDDGTKYKIDKEGQGFKLNEVNSFWHGFRAASKIAKEIGVNKQFTLGTEVIKRLPGY